MLKIQQFESVELYLLVAQQVATSASAATPGTDSDMELIDNQTPAGRPARVKVIRCVKAPAPFKDFEMEFEEMEDMILADDQVVVETNRMGALTVDSAVQTDHELLHDMINGLRKRKVSSSTNKSEYSHCCGGGHVGSGHSRTPSASTPSGSIPLSDPCSSTRANQYRKDASRAFEAYDSHEPRALCAYSVSPLHNDNSPLLAADRNVLGYASTSEETLGDGLAEPMHDLDKLLKDVEPSTGSLNSLLNSTTNLYSDSNASKASERTVVPSAQKQRTRSSSHSSAASLNAHAPTSRVHVSKHSKSSQHQPRDNQFTRPYNTQRLSLNGSAASAPRNDAASQMTSHNVTSRAAIPRILVERASRSSSDVSPDSGRPSDCAFDSRRTSLLSARADRTSAEISSMEDLSMCVSDLSNTDSPVFLPADFKHKGNKEHASENTTEFREYLRNKGMKLDLNTVQSSQV